MPDVNVLAAISDKDHIHHQAATRWFDTAGLAWAICPFTEAGLLRYLTRPPTGSLSLKAATILLTRLAEEPGYQYQAMASDWRTLSGPISRRLLGHKQVTDAYLLGLAIRESLILVTFDKAILHLAGDHARHMLLLK